MPTLKADWMLAEWGILTEARDCDISQVTLAGLSAYAWPTLVSPTSSKGLSGL
jgi:hypothetical protein